jgi:cellulose synthase/poly-beta-1,6-N-acetylglucosamine synthase-like glycosyltransferase
MAPAKTAPSMGDEAPDSPKVDNAAGRKVWVPHRSDKWRLGTVLSSDAQSGMYRVELAGVKAPFRVPSKMCHLWDPTHSMLLDDMSQMNGLHAAPLMSQLHRRLVESEKMYTKLGDMLISVNPYKEIPSLYDVNVHRSASEPHVFNVAKNALDALRQNGSSQSLVVKGESGAGKTEAAKQMMKFILHSSKAADATQNPEFEKNMVLSTLVHESFGNAASMHNDNSSRFGRLTRIHYNKEGLMLGSSVKHYFLERTRLSDLGSNESTFHAFYQLLACTLPEAELKTLGIKGLKPANFGLLKNSPSRSSDAEMAQNVTSAMLAMGFDQTDLQNVRKVLAFVLHCSDVTYKEVNKKGAHSSQVYESPNIKLGAWADLLGMEKDALIMALTSRMVMAGSGTSVLQAPMNAMQSRDNMLALAKSLYSKLFDWISYRMNEAIRGKTMLSESDAKVGILDIFGFEILTKNSFEQLCINFSNERIQQKFNQTVFVREMDMYAHEELKVDSIKYSSNQHIIDLLADNTTGLFSILEDQILMGRKNNELLTSNVDTQVLSLFHKTHGSDGKEHPSYVKPRFAGNVFTVVHFAGQVDYCIESFVSKNTCSLSDDLSIAIIGSSSNSFVKMLVLGADEEKACPFANYKNDFELKDLAVRQAAAAPSDGKKMARKGSRATMKTSASSTLSGTFTIQVNEFMSTLEKTDVHFINCIKPNHTKSSSDWNAELVHQQLSYSGVLDVVRIRVEGYPHKFLFSNFVGRFGETKKFATASFSAESECTNIMDANHVGNDLYQIGKTMIFVKDEGLKILTDAQADRLSNCAIIIQCAFRMHKACQIRATLAANRKAMVANARAAEMADLAMRAKQATLLQKAKAALTLQAFGRMVPARADFLDVKAAAIICQSTYRAKKVRAQYLANKAALEQDQAAKAFNVAQVDFSKMKTGVYEEEPVAPSQHNRMASELRRYVERPFDPNPLPEKQTFREDALQAADAFKHDIIDPQATKPLKSSGLIRMICLLNVLIAIIYLHWRVTETMHPLKDAVFWHQAWLPVYPWCWTFFMVEIFLTIGVWIGHAQRLFPVQRVICNFDDLVEKDETVGFNTRVAILMPTNGERLDTFMLCMIGAISQQTWKCGRKDVIDMLRLIVLDEQRRGKMLRMTGTIYGLATIVRNPAVVRILNAESCESISVKGLYDWWSVGGGKARKHLYNDAWLNKACTLMEYMVRLASNDTTHQLYRFDDEDDTSEQHKYHVKVEAFALGMLQALNIPITDKLEPGFYHFLESNPKLPRVIYYTRESAGTPKVSPKAGNLNSALFSIDHPEIAPFVGNASIVSINDCRHQLHTNFLQRTLPYFFKVGEDGKYNWDSVSFVQTPQRFLDEQMVRADDPLGNTAAVQYDIINVGKDGIGAVSSSGHGSLWRLESLMGCDVRGERYADPRDPEDFQKIGNKLGFRAEMLVEDTHTSIDMFRYGWESRYINEPGELLSHCTYAPSSIDWRIKQVLRWHQGAVQLLFYKGIRYTTFSGRHPTLWHRLYAFDQATYYFQAFPGYILLLMPIIYGLTGQSPFDTKLATFFLYFTPYVVTSMLPTTLSSGWRGVHSDKLSRDEQIWLSTTYVQVWAFISMVMKQFKNDSGNANSWSNAAPQWPLFAAFFGEFAAIAGGLYWISVYGFYNWIANFLAVFASAVLAINALWPMVSLQLHLSMPSPYYLKMSAWIVVGALIVCLDAVGNPAGQEKFIPTAVTIAKGLLALDVY